MCSKCSIKKPVFTINTFKGFDTVDRKKTGVFWPELGTMKSDLDETWRKLIPTVPRAFFSRFQTRIQAGMSFKQKEIGEQTPYHASLSAAKKNDQNHK